MVARAFTVAFEGVEARLVEVQCAVAPGMPSFALVGLPDKAGLDALEGDGVGAGSHAVCPWVGATGEMNAFRASLLSRLCARRARRGSGLPPAGIFVAR